MRNKLPLVAILCATAAHADAYSTLLKRYESQIRQQEKQLSILRKSLVIKEKETRRWQQKAESAKSQWTEAGLAVENARKMVRSNRERRNKTRSKVQTAQWSVIEHTSEASAAMGQLNLWTSELYKETKTPHYF
jgi:chromosome segregation ATPase